jgi:uncharacterized protein
VESQTLDRVIAGLLIAIAIVLVLGHGHNSVNRVAGRDSSCGNRGHCRCRSQTRADIKLAGGLSLAVSLPTMIVGFTRHRRDRSFAVLGQNRSFV